MDLTACPLCGYALLEEPIAPDGDRFRVGCTTCGQYQISGTLAECLEARLRGRHSRAKVSRYVWRLARSGNWPILLIEDVDRVVAGPLPRPQEQYDNLILALGTETEAYGDIVELDYQNWMPRIGCATEAGVKDLVEWACGEGNIDGIQNHQSLSNARLTLKGRLLFESLTRERVNGRKAFMAMAFGNAELTKIYETVLKPACHRAGYELQRMDSTLRAGLVDDQIRVAIRTSRFLVVDLTDDNAGAYWEAGFGEGLGRHVFYTCETRKFDGGRGVHFDTNHLATVEIDYGDPATCGERLLAMIRTTLPLEAILEDGPAPARALEPT